MTGLSAHLLRCAKDYVAYYAPLSRTCMSTETWRQLPALFHPDLFANQTQSASSMFKLFNPEQNREVQTNKKLNNPAFVKSPGQIVRLLKILEDDRSLLTVTLDNSKGYFASSIIGVQPEALLLDELTPAIGHRLLLERKTLKAFATLRGIKTSFKCRLIQSAESKGVAYYKCGLPEELYYPQKRQYHRCSMKGARKVSFQAVYGDNLEPLEGMLYDISRGGVGILIDNEIQIDSGEILHDCVITLPGKNTIRFDLQITFSNTLNRTKKTRIGGFFLHLDVPSEALLGRFITEAEREAVRKSRG